MSTGTPEMTPPGDPLEAKTGLPAEQRRARAQIAAHSRWSRTTNRTAATAAARGAQLRKLEDQVDPKRELSPELRGKLVENARRAQMISMAYVMHPTDAETIDLTRWGASGGLLVPGGYGSSGESASTNIFGGPEIQRVISPSVPQGTALLADWSTIRLYVREQINVLLDISGELFKSNQFIARGEGRFGIGVLRPSAIADIDLTP